MAEEEEVLHFGRTGFFRDGDRRVDLVLVVEDDGSPKFEQMRIEFLTNAVMFGLNLELEPGLMIFHKNLVFIKVHAPESIIEEYGQKFEVCRYFKQNHVEFVNPRGFIQRLLSYVGYRRSHEKEWIKLVRKKYPNPKRFSTHERSLIVYQLLLLVRFGEYENYIGIDRLLQKRIILDAYPLHDGPYFAVPRQFPSEYNARQILNYNWVSLRNVLKPQPLNLIHEYFGDRLACFFAFYAFYTYSLIIPALISTMAIEPELRNKTKNPGGLAGYIPGNWWQDPTFRERGDIESNAIMCPRCFNNVTCPYLKYKMFEKAVEINNIFDKENVDDIVVYIVIWATFFVIFWKRKEYYWMWMWEFKPELLANTARAAYVPNKEDLQGQQNRKFQPILRFLITLVTGLLTIVCLLLVWALLLAGLMFLQEYLMMQLEPKLGFDSIGHYKVMTIFYLINVIFIIILDKVCTFVSYTLTNLQNHRTEIEYENSLVLKLFGFTFPLTCTLFIYLAFIKNRVFTHPFDDNMIEYWGVLMNQCNPNGCSDELALSLFVTIITRECVFKLLSHLHTLFFMRTDYNQGKSLNINVPCWEREYRLSAVNEDVLCNKLKSLAMQFGFCVGFINGCPLTLIFIVCTNILDIRMTARHLVNGCRRPLLQGNRGIGAWKNVFLVLIFITLIMNSLIVAVTTSRFRESDSKGSHRRYPYFYYLDRDEYRLMFTKGLWSSDKMRKYEFPLYCLFPRSSIIQRIFQPYDYSRHNWYRLKLGTHYLATQVFLTSFAVVTLLAVIPTSQSDVQYTKAIEKAIFKNR